MTELEIEGMQCAHCTKAVADALAAVPGVQGQPEVSLERGSARVQGSADPEALVAAVAEAGYQARLRR